MSAPPAALADPDARTLADARPRSPAEALLVEAAGVVTALALALAVTAILFAGPKAPLLLRDGDSMLPLLWRNSVLAGQPQHWVSSTPLFLVEFVLYGPALLLPLPGAVTMALVSAIGWLALYVAVRVLGAALGLARRIAVPASLAVIALLAVEAATERSPDRNALEPVALLSTATYYSGTVVASVVILATVTRALRGRAASARSGMRDRMPWAVAAGALTLVATASNPIVVAWTVGPLVLVVLLTGLLAPRPASTGSGGLRTVSFAVVAALVVGAGLGMLGRLPVANVLVQDSAAKVRPDLAGESLAYYAGLARDRLSEPLGPVEAALMTVAIAVAAAALVLALWERQAATAAGVSARAIPGVLAAFTLVSALAVTVAAIGAGTFAARYLQPVALFPPLGVLALATVLAARARSRPRESARTGRLAPLVPVATLPITALPITALAVAALATSGLGIAAATVAIDRATAFPDPDVACAADWVDAHPGSGAGQYWSVRAVKAAIADPRRLVQTDERLNGYSWLSNDDDLRARSIRFTVTDAESPPFAIDAAPTATVRCGRFTIADYGDAALTLGPAHH